MANSRSARKRIRQAEKRRIANRYASRTTRNMVRDLRAAKTKEEATAMYPEVCSALDKLAKRNIIHRNKANNLKSSLALHINKM